MGYGLGGEFIAYFRDTFLTLSIRSYEGLFGLPDLYHFPESSTHRTVVRCLASWQEDILAKETSQVLLVNFCCNLCLGVVP